MLSGLKHGHLVNKLVFKGIVVTLQVVSVGSHALVHKQGAIPVAWIVYFIGSLRLSTP